jgi:two-component system, OmpR family, sensor histidine kinase VicK
VLCISINLTFSPNPKRKTEVLYGNENALKRGVQFMQNVKERMDISFDSRAPSIVIEVEAYKNGYTDIRRRGAKIRALTEITKDNINYCKELMKIVDEFRHLDGLKGGIAVSETEYMATTILREAEPLAQVIYSDVEEIIEQQQYFFDTIWRNGIPAKRRIREIEDGLKREFIDTIKDSNEIEKITFNLLRSATEEILILFSGANTFRRYEEYDEMSQIIKEAALQHGVTVRILADIDDIISKISRQNLREKEVQSISIQHLSRPQQTKITILIVDKAYCMTIEMKDPSARTFDDAIGLATYSNSESTVSSYISIFENLWVQSEIHQQKVRKTKVNCLYWF